MKHMLGNNTYLGKEGLDAIIKDLNSSNGLFKGSVIDQFIANPSESKVKGIITEMMDDKVRSMIDCGDLDLADFITPVASQTTKSIKQDIWKIYGSRAGDLIVRLNHELSSEQEVNTFFDELKCNVERAVYKTFTGDRS